MKSTLYLRLWAPVSTPDNTMRIVARLERTFHSPFSPRTDIELCTDLLIEADGVPYDAYLKLSASLPERMNCFSVINVFYRVNDEEYCVTAGKTFESQAQAINASDLLTRFYGFTSEHE